MGFSILFLLLAAIIVILGLGALIVWLCRQVSGAKNSMAEAKARQEETERGPIDFD